MAHRPLEYPLLGPLMAAVAGILISHLARFEAREAAVAAALLGCIACLSARRSARLALASCLAAILFAGILLDVWRRPGPPPQIDAGSQETVLLAGCVVEPTIFYEGRDQFTLELGPRISARVSLAVRDGETPPELRYGQLVEVEARVRSIRNYQNPGGFDFAAYSARRNIYWNASARAGGQVRVLPGRCGSRFWAAIFGLRVAALNRIEALYPNSPYATGMMQAILLGESAKLEKIWTDHFRRTGTFHALVISGLHVTVLAGSLLFLLRVCFVPEFAGLAFTAAAAWLYALVSGWSAPVVRAAGGFSLYLVGRYFYRRGRLINLLAAVSLAYLIYDPGQLFEASFQLSFLSVTAIAALAVPLLDATSAPFARNLGDIADTRRDARMPARPAQFRVELRLLAETLSYYMPVRRERILFVLGLSARLVFYVYEMVVLSTIVQVGLALPMAIYFHRISFTGLSANVIIVPLLSLVVPAGFLAIFSGWSWVAAAAGWLLAAAEKVASWHARFEPAWRTPDPPLWLSLAFAAALLALSVIVRRSRQWRWPSVGAVLALFGLIVWHPFPARVTAGQLELSAIDVGQGDSLFLAFPDGKLMLVDGGGILAFGRRAKPKLDIGEDVVSAYLWSRSIRRLDVIAATHAHADHIGGMAALIDNFRPRELWTGADPDSEAWRDIAAHARAAHTKIVPMRAGRELPFGGARIAVISPPEDYSAGEKAANNDSLALRIVYGERSFLLTGDMEKAMEARALEEGRALHADVLKVAHHGSKTSSIEPFLEAVSPQFAVISDGFENSFHHPHREVLERLAARRAGILRTDREGLITIRTDGERLFVETFRAGRMGQAER